MSMDSSRPLFATSSKIKFGEASSLIPTLDQLDIDLPEFQTLDVREVVEAKMNCLKDLDLRRPVLVEDTGLKVPQAGGLPGALVKWFLAAIGSAGTSELLRRGHERTPARAVCAVGVVVGSSSHIWEGGDGRVSCASPRRRHRMECNLRRLLERAHLRRNVGGAANARLDASRTAPQCHGLA